MVCVRVVCVCMYVCMVYGVYVCTVWYVCVYVYVYGYVCMGVWYACMCVFVLYVYGVSCMCDNIEV